MFGIIKKTNECSKQLLRTRLRTELSAAGTGIHPGTVSRVQILRIKEGDHHDSTEKYSADYSGRSVPGRRFRRCPQKRRRQEKQARPEIRRKSGIFPDPEDHCKEDVCCREARRHKTGRQKGRCHKQQEGGYLTPQNSERRMAPVFLRQIEISYYS